MSVFDYIEGISLFTPYELKCLDMYIEEYVPKDDPLFAYLKDVSVRDVELFWYCDRDPEVLGGYWLLSRNVIYINRSFAWVYDGEGMHAAANRVAMVFPTVMHELCHYWQSRKYGPLYLLMQLPLVREFAIERQANAISDRLYSDCRVNGMSVRELAELKMRHGFGRELFDESELAALEGGAGASRKA